MITSFFNSFSTADFLPWLIFLISFLLGSIPFGLLVARVFHVRDLTHRGSRNIGATNVSRIVGFWPAGVITFVLDLSKGLLSVLLAMPLGCHLLSLILGGGTGVQNIELNSTQIWGAGFFSVLGHCYSPWLQFKGGKGVATGLGAILLLSPLSALFGVLGFALTFAHKRIASISSIAGLIIASIAYLVLNPMGNHLWVSAALIFLIMMRHEANIDALLQNKERSFR